MIKFFRKIRQRLLSENKFSKYLLYAIGEIFLVVIGILIALQINNWNQNRLLQIKKQNYIENIKEDLNLDIINIEKLISHGKKQEKDIESFNVFILDDKISIKQALDSSLKLNTPFYRYFPVNQTFLDMQSSGNSELLTDAQRKALIDLFYFQNRLEIANEKIIQTALLEISNRNQYITRRNDFQKLFEVEIDQKSINKAILHQLNYLEEMRDLAEVMNRFGSIIKTKSLVAIDSLNTK
jgi:hypothetical protein